MNNRVAGETGRKLFESSVHLSRCRSEKGSTGCSTIPLNGVNPADENLAIELSTTELRAVAAYAVSCAEPALAIFEHVRPDDQRPRAAIEAAQTFAEGAKRTKLIRDTAWAAHRAFQETRDAGQVAASEAARAAVAAASAAFLHPLAKATQVLHILGSAAHAARAFELRAGDEHIEKARNLASPTVVSVLTRYPPAPAGRGRAGELLRTLDTALRQPIIDAQPDELHDQGEGPASVPAVREGER